MASTYPTPLDRKGLAYDPSSAIISIKCTSKLLDLVQISEELSASISEPTDDSLTTKTESVMLIKHTIAPVQQKSPAYSRFESSWKELVDETQEAVMIKKRYAERLLDQVGEAIWWQPTFQEDIDKITAEVCQKGGI